MAYIYPNTTIKLLSQVPFDSDYNHTKNFWGTDEKLAQYNYFSGFTKMSDGVLYSFSNQSYQRVNNNTLRIAMKADKLYDINYMMFQNTAYGSKWFYAFVNQVNYINDNCSEIVYEIDVMQTWFFDYELRPCFVEREHAITDNIGDNLVAENIDYGELECTNTYPILFEYFLGGIITSKPVASNINPSVAGLSLGTYSVKTQYGPDAWGIWGGTPDGPAGVPSGLYMMYGFPISDTDITRYWNVMRNSYDMQNYNVTGIGGYLTLGKMVEFICDGNIHSATIGGIINPLGNLSIDDIVSVFIYPAEINRLANQSNATAKGFRPPMGVHEYAINNRAQYFRNTYDGSIYFPKNKKLFTFPYVSLKISNNMGQTINLKYEEMSGYTSDYFEPHVSWVGNITGNPNVTLFFNYNGVIDNFDYSISIGDFPTPAYKGSQFSQWLQTNKFSWMVGTLSSAISLANGIAAMESTTKNIPISSSTHTERQTITDTGIRNSSSFTQTQGQRTQYTEGKSFPLQYATSALSQIAQPLDILNAPNTVGNTITNDVINVGTNRVGFMCYSMAIKGQYAKRIDDYFTMFGYATKAVKVPNVMNRTVGTKIRNNFMYTKTIGAIVTPKLGFDGIPQDDIRKIQSIYDRGITFWRDGNVLGDYTVDNSIITIS